MPDKNITEHIKFQENDGECLPLITCVCGAEFIAWDFILGIYREDARECPYCKCKMYFVIEIKVYEVKK